MFLCIFSQTSFAQTVPVQVNTCSQCTSNADCTSDQICINELDTANNPTWEWTIKELSQIPDNQWLTGWDQFEYSKYKTFRAVANGKVYTRNVVSGKWGSWQEIERFTCGASCGDGEFIYGVNVMERNGLITFHLVRSGGIYAKSFAASNYSANIAYLLNQQTGWINVSTTLLGVGVLEPKTALYTGFDSGVDHLGNLNQTLVKFDVNKAEPYIYKRTLAKSGWTSWKRVRIWVDPKNGTDILIYSLARPIIVFGIDDYYSPSTKKYIYKVIGYSTKGKEVFRKVYSAENKNGFCKKPAAVEIKCGNSQPLKCQVDNKFVSYYANKVVGVATNQPLFYSQEDIHTVASALSLAKVKFVRRGLHWHVTEQKKGEYWWETKENGQGMFDSAATIFSDKGLTLLGTLTGTPKWASSMPEDPNYYKYPVQDIAAWENFIAKTIERYGSQPGGKNQVTNWEIWNEPNFPEFFMGNSDDYIKLLNSAYTTAHNIDPKVKIWGPTVLLPYQNTITGEDALTFIDKVIRYGKFDVFSIHIYADIADQHNYIKIVRQKLDKDGKKHIPIAVTEANLKIGKEYPYCPSDSNQSEILKQIYACMYSAGAQSVFWFSAKDHSGEAMCQYKGGVNKHGILTTELEPKASYDTLSAIGNFLYKQPTPVVQGAATTKINFLEKVEYIIKGLLN